jgi:hypothetical protein
MAMVNGFFTTMPTAADAGDNAQSPEDQAYAQKFVCGGSGSLVANKIGSYCTADGNTNGRNRMWIAADNAGAPGTTVANSLTPAITSLDPGWANYTYSTKPQLTGGATYWLVTWCATAYDYMIGSEWKEQAGGSPLIAACTYHATNNPSPGSWGVGNFDAAMAVEYQAAGGGTILIQASECIGSLGQLR